MQQSLFTPNRSPNRGLQPKDAMQWQQLRFLLTEGMPARFAGPRLYLLGQAQDCGISPGLVGTFIDDGQTWSAASSKLRQVIGLARRIWDIDPKTIAPADPALWQGMADLSATEEA